MKFFTVPKKIVPILCLLLISGTTLRAQPNLFEQPSETAPLNIGTVHGWHSRALGEYRELNIYTPTGYHPDSALTYPVIYLLDGSVNEDFLHIAGILQFMDMMDLFPPHILVGIANTNRRHDFTHPSTDTGDLKLIPNGGGSKKFIEYIQMEVQRYVSLNFAVNDRRTLIGQSLGGLLATEILLHRPELFTRYIIVSPSLWWGKGALLASAPEKLKAFTAQNRPAEVYIAVGKEGDQMERDAARLAETLKAAKIAGMKLDFEEFSKETHATILHNAIYQTLLKIK